MPRNKNAIKVSEETLDAMKADTAKGIIRYTNPPLLYIDDDNYLQYMGQEFMAERELIRCGILSLKFVYVINKNKYRAIPIGLGSGKLSKTMCNRLNVATRPTKKLSLSLGMFWAVSETSIDVQLKGHDINKVTFLFRVDENREIQALEAILRELTEKELLERKVFTVRRTEGQDTRCIGNYPVDMPDTIMMPLAEAIYTDDLEFFNNPVVEEFIRIKEREALKEAEAGKENL